MPHSRVQSSWSSRVKDSIVGWFRRVKQSRVVRRSSGYLERRPFVAFFISLGVLLLIIILANILSGLSKKDIAKPIITKDVTVYRTAASPSVQLQGQVEKSGVYKITAQTSGVVQDINLNEGDEVRAGQTILDLSSNYQGDNASALQASLAQKQYQNELDTYNIQKAAIDDQRDIATESASNTDRLRQIANGSFGDTDSAIQLNRDILSIVQTQLRQLENSNINGANDAQILQTKQQVSQITAGLDALQAQARNLGYQADTANPPTQLANTQEDLTLKQLMLQQKSLDLNKDVSRIQANLAYVQASLMNPASPGDGTIDRIYVHVGDNITPGTVLALVTGNKEASTLVVHVPDTLISEVSRVDASSIHIGNVIEKIVPTFVSHEATDGQLYSIIYALPTSDASRLTNASFVSVDVPLNSAASGTSEPYIPLDAVYQTQNSSYVYVLQQGKAITRTVVLGSVYGKFVSLSGGLQSGDVIITNRNIVAGDKVRATN